jgi:hypothetical protein
MRRKPSKTGAATNVATLAAQAAHELPYTRQRREATARHHRVERFVFVIDALLILLVLGDLANLFMAVETALRSSYLVITAITVSLTALCVILPFLAGKLWRQRARKAADANYPMVVALVFFWLVVVAGITLLRLSVDGLGPFAATGALGTAGGGGAASAGGAGAGAGAAQSGSAFAALGSASHAQSAGSSLALVAVLTAMLGASGIVAFTSAWMGGDPLRRAAREAEVEMVRLQEAAEELTALRTEFAYAEDYYRNLIEGDRRRYEAAQEKAALNTTRLRHRARLGIAESLCDPAATSALLEQPEVGEAQGLQTAQAARRVQEARELRDARPKSDNTTRNDGSHHEKVEQKAEQNKDWDRDTQLIDTFDRQLVGVGPERL